jgi:hypothetical protein
MQFYRFGLIALACCYCGSAGASEINGTWNFVWQTPGGERRSAMTMETAGDNVTARLGPEAKGNITGTFKDGRLTLSGPMYSAEAGQEGAFKLDGSLTSGELKGTASWNEHTITFTAKRAGFAGKWNFIWHTPGGDHNSTIVMTIDGDSANGQKLKGESVKGQSVTGKMGPEGGTGELTGILLDGRLVLTGPVTSNAGVPGTLRIDGKVEASRITGRATWNAYDMAFSARRAD